MRIPAADSASSASLTNDELGRVAAACEACEAAWQMGTSPETELFLQEATGAVREALLFELLAIEAFYRRNDPGFCADACVGRFPDHAESIRRWFSTRFLIFAQSECELGDSDSSGEDEAGAQASDAETRSISAAEVRAASAGSELSPEADGRRSVDRFRVLRPFAEGGLGRIWVARDVELGREVAFKEIQPRHADDPTVQARFVREAEITGRLEHPGIVPVYGSGQHIDGRPFYAMRLVDGETLEAAIGRWHAKESRYGDVEFRQLLRRFLDVCNVVEFAHRRGVVHRDLKPRNVMVGQFGETIVLDWGFARMDEQSHGLRLATDGAPSGAAGCQPAGSGRIEDDSGLTAPGMVFGTPAYMSPEQAAGHVAELGPTSDVFCLGGILYCLLTGQPPYHGSDRREAIERAAKCHFQRPRELRRRVPAPLESICLRAMNEEPNDRYVSARALADDLEHWLADEPATAHRERWTARIGRRTRRHKSIALAIAVAAGMLIAALGAIIGLERRSRIEIIARNEVIERQRDASFTLIQRDQLARAGRASRQFRAEARAALRLVPEPRRGWEWRRLSHQLNLGPRAMESFAAHDWGVLDLLWDEPTSILVTAGHDGRLLLWRRGDQAPRELVNGSWSVERLAWRHALFGFPEEHDRPQAGKQDAPLTSDCCVALCWLRPGSEFIAVSQHGSVTAWHLPADTGKARGEQLAMHGRPLHAVSAQNGKVLCGDDRGTLLLLDVSALASAETPPRLVPLGSPSGVVAIAPLSDGRWIVAQAGGDICLLDAEVTRVIARLSSDAPIWDVDVSPEGRFLAVASGRSDIVCYRVEGLPERWSVAETYRLPDDLTPAGSAVHAVRFSPDGRLLAGGDDRGRLIVWQTDTARVSLVGTSGRVLTVQHTERLPLPFRRRTAAIRFGASADECFLGGHDPVVRRWRLRSETGISALHVDGRAIVRFDPLDPELMWVATTDGLLSLRDSRDGHAIDTAVAHHGPITGFSVRTNVPTVESATDRDSRRNDVSDLVLSVTCGQDGAIRGWTRRGEKIVAACKAIRHPSALTDVALSPDGRRVAACDSASQAVLWDLVDGRMRASRNCAERTPELSATSAKLRKRKLAPKPRLAFNVDGTRLAVFGPAATCALLDGTNLSVIERPYLLAGEGGTALLWHPLEADTLFAGDTLGRIARHPSRGWGDLDMTTAHSFGVVGIAYSRHGDGGRLAVAWQDGTVRIIDPKWAGEVLMLQSSLSNARQPNAADVQFDPSGSRLALVHDGGVIEIWETPRPNKLPIDGLTRQWRRRTLLDADRARGSELRPQAIALDQVGRLAMLFTSLDDGQHSADPEATGRAAFFGQECSSGLRIERLPGRVVPRSLALKFTGNGFVATLRRTVPSEGGTSGEFLLLRGELGNDGQVARWHEEALVPRPNNDGFDPQLLPGPEGCPAVVHFSHAGHYLMATWRDGGAWRSSRLGRQGDGLRQLAAFDARHQSLICCFCPIGWNGNPRTPVCITTTVPWIVAGDLDRAWQGQGRREVIDAAPGARLCALALAPDGTPLVLYSRFSENGRECLACAHREATGWRSSTVLDFCPNVSNLAVDHRGLVSFAFVEEDEMKICLAVGRDDRWSVEAIGELPPDAAPVTLHSPPPDLTLVANPVGHVEVVIATRKESGAVWAFRPN